MRLSTIVSRTGGFCVAICQSFPTALIMAVTGAFHQHEMKHRRWTSVTSPVPGFWAAVFESAYSCASFDFTLLINKVCKLIGEIRVLNP